MGCSYYGQAAGENSGSFLSHSKILAALRGLKKKEKKRKKKVENPRQNQMQSQVSLLLFNVPHLHGNVRHKSQNSCSQVPSMVHGTGTYIRHTKQQKSISSFQNAVSLYRCRKAVTTNQDEVQADQRKKGFAADQN